MLEAAFSVTIARAHFFHFLFTLSLVVIWCRVLLRVRATAFNGTEAGVVLMAELLASERLLSVPPIDCFHF